MLKTLMLIISLVGVSICHGQVASPAHTTPQKHLKGTGEMKWVTVPVKSGASETFRVLLNIKEACISQKAEQDEKTCREYWGKIPAAYQQPLKEGEKEFFNHLFDTKVRITKGSYCALKKFHPSCGKEWERLPKKAVAT